MSTTSGDEDNETAVTRGFWARQFRGPPSGAQRVFDAFFGLVLPPICFAVDPIVFVLSPQIFVPSSHFTGVLTDWALFVYLAAGMAMAFLASWMLLGDLLGRTAAVWCGAMGIAALAAAMIGALLLPFTLIGLLWVIGILGLSPFGTAFAFGRGARRAWTRATEGQSRRRRDAMVLAGVLAVVGPPAAANAYVRRLVEHASTALPSASEQTAAAIVSRLDAVPWCPAACGRPLVQAFDAARDDPTRERLRRAFRALTHREVDRYSQVMPGVD